MRPKPEYILYVDDGDKYRPKSLKKDPEWIYVVPPGWDVNLMDGYYIAAVIIAGKVVFRPHNTNFHLEFSFCKELAYLLGAALNHQSHVWFTSPPMGHP